jgi:hypothetical protein
VPNKLVFKTEQDMLKAFLGCKFAQIECETEYDSEQSCDVDSLSFEFEDVK